jgi:carbonic anhydrase/acetyltransferase-like protein (isoleucine patch superfamily)
MRDPHIPQPTIAADAVVAPGARVYGNVTIGARAFILFGVVVRAELDRIEIGAQTNIQDNSVLHCDEGVPCLVGERVTVGHSAVVHGAVVGDDALIGIGAKALNRSTVGEGALLAAGSVLAEGKEIPPYTLAMGIPAKPVRELTGEEIARNAEGVGHYLALATAYREIFANLP